MPAPARPRPSPAALARYADGFNQSQTLKFFGARVSFPTEERVRVDLTIRPEHRGGLGSDAINGGVLAAMFDLVIGCSSALIDPTHRSATVQLSMSFERAVVGEALWAEARVDRSGGALLFASASLMNAHGEVCARCQGVVRLSSLPWASGDSPAIN